MTGFVAQTSGNAGDEIAVLQLPPASLRYYAGSGSSYNHIYAKVGCKVNAGDLLTMSADGYLLTHKAKLERSDHEFKNKLLEGHVKLLRQQGKSVEEIADEIFQE